MVNLFKTIMVMTLALGMVGAVGATGVNTYATVGAVVANGETPAFVEFTWANPVQSDGWGSEVAVGYAQELDGGSSLKRYTASAGVSRDVLGVNWVAGAGLGYVDGIDEVNPLVFAGARVKLNSNLDLEAKYVDIFDTPSSIDGFQVGFRFKL